MIKLIIIRLLAAILSSLLLLSLGLIIWYFKQESQTSLQTVLFWVGSVTIALFSIGLFGNFSGKGEIAYLLNRTGIDKSGYDNTLSNVSDLKFSFLSGLNWILSGLIILIIHYFL
jgi:hypothetical protein